MNRSRQPRRPAKPRPGPPAVRDTGYYGDSYDLSGDTTVPDTPSSCSTSDTSSTSTGSADVGGGSCDASSF